MHAWHVTATSQLPETAAECLTAGAAGCRTWRLTGLAYEQRDCSYPQPNRLLLSTAQGRSKEFKDRWAAILSTLVYSMLHCAANKYGAAVPPRGGWSRFGKFACKAGRLWQGPCCRAQTMHSLQQSPMTCEHSCCAACQQEPQLRQPCSAQPAALPFNKQAQLLLSWPAEAPNLCRQVRHLWGSTLGTWASCCSHQGRGGDAC